MYHILSETNSEFPVDLMWKPLRYTPSRPLLRLDVCQNQKNQNSSDVMVTMSVPPVKSSRHQEHIDGVPYLVTLAISCHCLVPLQFEFCFFPTESFLIHPLL